MKEINKTLKNSKQRILIGIFGILLSLCIVTPIQAKAQNTNNQTEYSFRINTVATLEERLSNVLGVLDKEVTVEEKAKSYEYLSTITNLENSRTTYVQTQEEIAVIQEFNTYLNDLTKKYIPDSEKYAQELEDAFGPLTLSKTNAIIENIKGILSTSDYSQINTIYSQYVDNIIEINDAADQIYTVLYNYQNKLSIDEVLYNIFTVEYGTKGRFTIKSDLSLKYQNPTGTGLSKLSKKKITEYKKVWTQIKKILPSKYLGAFKEFNISSDGEYGIAAFVEQLDSAGRTWRISIDPADMKNKTEFYYTVVHEFGHYISLNSSQVKYFNNDNNLTPSKDDYYDYSLAANKNSYLNKYFTKFWKDYTFDRDADTLNQLFYFRHYDEFLSEYASTSVTEDFAESFSFFVLGATNTTSKMKERMNFFNDFPELVQMKKAILSNMKKNNLYK